MRTVASGTATPGAPLAGTVPLAKRGAGTLVIDQPAAFAAGSVYVEEGTLQIGSGGTTGIAGTPLAVTVSSGATLAFDRSDDYGGAFADQIGGGGGVVLRGGALALTGSNSFTGGTTIAGGTLAIGNGGTTGWLGGPISNGGTLVFSRSDAVTFGGTIDGSGGVVKSGAGVLTLSATTNGYTGGTRIAAGTLRITAGGQTGSGTLVPLAGGTLAFASALTTVVPGLDPNAGGLVDVATSSVTVAGGLSAAAMVTAILAGRGDGSWTGASGITSADVAASVAANVPRAIGWLDDGGGAVTFAYAAPGDANIDGQVDILDAANFAAAGKYGTGEPATWSEGDFGYDGVVDILDVSDFMSTGLYGAGSYIPPVPGAVAAVPEPGVSTAAAVAGACGAVAWRWRRRGRPL